MIDQGTIGECDQVEVAVPIQEFTEALCGEEYPDRMEWSPLVDRAESVVENGTPLLQTVTGMEELLRRGIGAHPSRGGLEIDRPQVEARGLALAFDIHELATDIIELVTQNDHLSLQLLPLLSYPLESCLALS